MDVTSQDGPKASEVLVLDSCTFIAEIGLTSKGASALKHYLFHRGTELVVLQTIAKECERVLATRAEGKKKSIEACLEWLARFCDGVSGWNSPSDGVIKKRAKMLANAQHLKAVILPESETLRQRAKSRNQNERPPGHWKSSENDCKLWEQCLDLMANHDVILVSSDKDFRGYANTDDLHPQLRAEAGAVGACTGRKLTFHRSMKFLLSELRSEIPPIPREDVFAFVYGAIAADRQELETNSGCRPTETGNVEQTLLTTDQVEIVEVRLEVEDQWVSPDGSRTYDFSLRGSCHYSLAEHQLTGLTVSNLRLSKTEEDGTVRAVKGSYVSIAARAYAGAAPIEPEPEVIA